MTTPEFRAPESTDLSGILGHSQGEIDRVVQRMNDNGISVTRANVEHALHGDRIRSLLIEAGINPESVAQISPTKDHKGMVRLTFEQVETLYYAT